MVQKILRINLPTSTLNCTTKLKMGKITACISRNVSEESKIQLNRVNEQLVISALKKMKRNKRDASMDIVSDCYIDGPPKLIEHLVLLIKLFLVHGSSFFSARFYHL